MLAHKILAKRERANFKFTAQGAKPKTLAENHEILKFKAEISNEGLRALKILNGSLKFAKLNRAKIPSYRRCRGSGWLAYRRKIYPKSRPF